MATIISRSIEETLAAARALAETLRAGDVIALTGDLGAGKTHFVKGLALGLGSNAEVTSPTFTLIHEYPGGRLPLFHFDLYRLDEAEEVSRIGFDEYLDADGVCVVEWGDKFPGLLPPETRWVRIDLLPNDERKIEGL
ncbi:MAG: tRNA (adenosine(37)-N6)-threonylcarbamoyltransferase complex ATPase subunit type 1 TsaE [Chthoniobacteraceae bacterium]